MCPHADHTSSCPGDGSQDRDESELLALASEELRGPLTSVSGFLQILLDGEAGQLTEGQERVAQIIARNAETMSRLIDELIVISEVRLGGLSEQRGPIDVPALVRERLFTFSDTLRARRAVVGVASDPVPEIVGDPLAIAQMIDQMIRGAATFVPFNGQIDVSVTQDRDGVMIEVGDDGGVFDEADLPDVFRGLTGRAPHSPRALVGSRMGLQLVHEVARAHGGRAEVNSRDGRTTVRATLRSCTDEVVSGP